MGTKTEVLNHFRSQLGYIEGPRNNETVYAEEAGHANFQAWCATFVVAMFRRAGITLPSESAWTPAMLNGLKDRRINKPEPGALAFLYFRSLNRVAHVGIVESVRSDGRFISIEGNTDVAGGRTGGRVMRKVRSPHGFTFAMPEYTESSKPAQPSAPDLLLTDVHRIQQAFEVDTDGKWGPETDGRALLMRAAARSKAGWPINARLTFDIRLVQAVIDTRVDGIWGPKSQAALVNWIKQIQWIIGVNADGQWGPVTDNTFLKFRRQFLNKY